MAEPILYVRSTGLGGLVATIAATVAIALIFALAIAVEVSLLAPAFFAYLVVIIAAEARQRLVQCGSIDDARRELDRIEREGAR
ncbi:hypothetical protein BH10PSE8_BH10PSE8_00790 [soil metagenome]